MVKRRRASGRGVDSRRHPTPKPEIALFTKRYNCSMAASDHLNKLQHGEHIVGYHHTNEESANKIMSEGFKNPSGWTYFGNSLDPDGFYGDHAIEIAVKPGRVELDPNSPVGHPWQQKEHVGNWSDKAFLVAPDEDVYPLKVHKIKNKLQK